jgi:hypothetical protein
VGLIAEVSSALAIGAAGIELGPAPALQPQPFTEALGMYCARPCRSNHRAAPVVA